MHFVWFSFSDLEHNEIRELVQNNGTVRPLEGLHNLQDILLSHNKISEVPDRAFEGLRDLKTL